MAARKKKKKPRRVPQRPKFPVEFTLSDAPNQRFYAYFNTRREARSFLNFNEENELLNYAALVY